MKGDSGVGNVNIVRNDRGLDFKRIEQIIKQFSNKVDSFINKIQKDARQKEKEREQSLYEHFGMTTEVEALKDIDSRIEELKSQRRAYESKIRNITQGTDEHNRYNTYDHIHEKSPAYEYIHQEEVASKATIEKLRGLIKEMSEQMWLAKDIDQAVSIYERFISELEAANS